MDLIYGDDGACSTLREEWRRRVREPRFGNFDAANVESNVAPVSVSVEFRFTFEV